MAARSSFPIRDRPFPPAHAECGSLITDPGILAHLAAIFCDAGGHALQRIVPYDIESEIFTDIGAAGPSCAELVTRGKSLLRTVSPWLGELLDSLLFWIVPIRHRPSGKPKKRGFSTPLCYGVFFLTFEDRSLNDPEESALQMAVDLAHEAGHHALYAYQSADTLIKGDMTVPVYSAVRQTNRPAIMSLHASAALAFMISLLRDTLGQPTTSPSQATLAARWRREFEGEQTRALRELGGAVSFTPVGKRIFTDFVAQLSDHPSDETLGLVG